MKASTTTTFPGFDVLRQSETKPPDPHLRKRTGHYQLLATADRHPVFLQLAGEFTIAEQYKIMKKTGPMPCLCYWPLAVQFIHFPDQAGLVIKSCHTVRVGVRIVDGKEQGQNRQAQAKACH